MIERKGLIERLEPRTMLSVSLVKDLNTSESGSVGPLPSLWDIEPAGAFTFLSASDTTAGIELYRTDGTEAGTTRIKDIRPGRDNSQPGWLTHMGGGVVLFSADNGVNGSELWRSDGTEAGTYLVKDINPGAASSLPSNLLNINGTVYFAATTATGGNELWKSDGTEAGTVQVKDINAGTADSAPAQLINNNGTLFFLARTVASGAELWKSNGTEAGTVQVKEMYNNNNNGVHQNSAMAVLNGYVYFAGITAASGTDLWRSDGTDAGTTMVAETSFSINNVLQGIKTSGNSVYYTVTTGTPTGLWRTDGTSPPNQIVNSIPIATVDVNGTLFYGLSGTIYTTTGGAPTTVKTGLTFRSFTGQYWANVNGLLYLPTHDGSGFGEELWRSDGTPGGTYMVKDINPGSAGSNPGVFFGTGGSNFLFGANRPDVGIELFKSDGTEPGTQLVKNIFTATAGSGPRLMTPFNGKLYFMAFVPGEGETGGELYSTDGTEAGTNLVADVNPGPAGSNINTLMRVFNGHLYFAATNGSSGRELWRTDGTTTTLVADINPGSADSNPSDLTVSGNYLYFGASNTANGDELWRVDQFGNVARLTDVNPLSGNSNIDIWGESNGNVYFTAGNTSSTTTLWRSNGTSANQHAANITSLSGALNINGTLYFAGTTSTNGNELFKIVGSGAPVLVKEIVGTSGSSSPQQLTDVNGTLYFSAISGSIGRELWKSDGTDAGTVLVKDIYPGFSNSTPTGLVGANGILYFRATHPSTGGELWRSDGTDAGTYLLKDIWPGSTTTFPIEPYSGDAGRHFAHGGFVYFAGEDGVNGRELWRTDGTTEGTVLYADLYPDPNVILLPSLPTFFAALGDDVYFLHSDDTHGDELWKATPDFAAMGGGGIVTVSATANNDVIDLSVSGGNVVITLNGLTETFAISAVSALQLVGKGGNDTVNVTSGTHTFSTDLRDALGSNVTLNIASGASASFGATQRLKALNLAAGATASLSAGGSRYLITDTLSIHPDGQLDLSDHDLVVNNGNFAEIQALVFAGFGSSTGITSSTSDGSQILAVFDNALIGATEWEGFPIGANAIVGKYTYFGDVNFDGQVTGDDYAVIDSNLDTDPPVGLEWLSGDANLDGIVTGDDYATIDSNFGLGVGNPLSPLSIREKRREEDFLTADTIAAS